MNTIQDTSAAKQALGQVNTQSKELEAFADRLENQNQQLSMIEGRLNDLHHRLDGTDSGNAGLDAVPKQSGTIHRLNDALSDNMKFINGISDLVQRLENLA